MIPSTLQVEGFPWDAVAIGATFVLLTLIMAFVFIYALIYVFARFKVRALVFKRDKTLGIFKRRPNKETGKVDVNQGTYYFEPRHVWNMETGLFNRSTRWIPWMEGHPAPLIVKNWDMTKDRIVGILETKLQTKENEENSVNPRELAELTWDEIEKGLPDFEPDPDITPEMLKSIWDTKKIRVGLTGMDMWKVMAIFGWVIVAFIALILASGQFV